MYIYSRTYDKRCMSNFANVASYNGIICFITQIVARITNIFTYYFFPESRWP